MRKLILASAILAAATFGAHAADLIIEPEAPMEMAPLASTSVYVQLLGGVAAGLDSEFYKGGEVVKLLTISGGSYTDAMEAGWAAAAALGVVVMEGLSIEADIFHTDRKYAEYDGGLTTTSVMVNGKYTAHASDMLDLYVAVGVGTILANDTYDGNDNDFSGFGYQLIAGAGLEVAENVSLVGEVRYQDSFSPLEDGDGNTFDIPIAAALVGVRIGF